jgi:hypothetical protein
VPNIVQISAFLISKDWLLKCVGLESADFQMSPSGIGLHPVSKFKVLIASPPTLFSSQIA